MKQELLYTAREIHSKSVNEESWSEYVEWSKLYHIKEVAGLDYMLNADLVENDRESNDYSEHVHLSNLYETGLYTSPEYVLAHIQTNKSFNFLAVTIKPEKDCSKVALENYVFLGYELLDLYFEISALTNCGGFNETFLPQDLNEFGLIDDFDKAYDIAERLCKNNPEEEHANTNVIAVWRHKFIGKQ